MPHPALVAAELHSLMAVLVEQQRLQGRFRFLGGLPTGVWLAGVFVQYQQHCAGAVDAWI